MTKFLNYFLGGHTIIFFAESKGTQSVRNRGYVFDRLVWTSRRATKRWLGGECDGEGRGGGSNGGGQGDQGDVAMRGVVCCVFSFFH